MELVDRDLKPGPSKQETDTQIQCSGKLISGAVYVSPAVMHAASENRLITPHIPGKKDIRDEIFFFD